MGDLIFLDQRRRMKERIQAAKRMGKIDEEAHQRRINELIGYAKGCCDWEDDDDEDS